MKDVVIPPAPYAPPGYVAKWVDGEWKIVPLAGSTIPPMPLIPKDFRAYWDNEKEEWLVIYDPAPEPPPPPTPEQITGETLTLAGFLLSEASWLSIPGVRENIMQESLDAIIEWENIMVQILMKAQKILVDGTGETYTPDWPPRPSLLPTLRGGLEFTVFFNDPSQQKRTP